MTEEPPIDLRDQLPAARALYAAAPQRYALADPIVVTTHDSRSVDFCGNLRHN